MKRECMLAVLLCACAEATPKPTGAQAEGSAAAPAMPVEEPSTPIGEAPRVEAKVALPVPVTEPDIVRGLSPGLAPSKAVALPRDMECVSAIDVDDGQVPSTWRATLVLDGAASHATLVESPRFQSHDGEWSGEESPEIQQQALHATGPLAFAGDAASGLALELAGESPFFSAVLRLGGTSTRLVCWDRIAIFGSAWSSQPVLLPRFDAALGECVDAAGAATEPSVLPLEFVLDTSHGECADLRRVELNAGDYAYPDIFINLRGANLGTASLHFANLTGSFEGARLGALDFGYASVSGSIDDATELPELGDCTVTESPWAGRSVTCRR